MVKLRLAIEATSFNLISVPQSVYRNHTSCVADVETIFQETSSMVDQNTNDYQIEVQVSGVLTLKDLHPIIIAPQ